MNVLHLIDSGGLYGAENVVLNLMNRQKELGFKTTLCSIGSKADGRKAIENKAAEVGLPVEIFRMRNGPNVSGAIRINKYAHNNNVDIIHCHGYKANILSALLPFKYGRIPYIVTLHGWTSTRIFTKMWAYECLDAIMAKRADRVVAVSHAMGENTRLKYLNISPLVIYNGIPDREENNIDKDNSSILIGVDKAELRLISIGRLSKEKGYDKLLKTVFHIKTKWNKNVRLFIVGEGPEKSNLAKLCQEYGISDDVSLPGYMVNAFKILKCFDIFVMSSLTEGMPITLLEAMRVGMPIVATAVGGIPEALEGGKCGILVPPGNEMDLAKKIVELNANSLLREDLSNKAKIRFQEEFTVEKMEEKYRTVYADVINKNNKNNRKNKNN
jgi:glycosyltransferase involved in cell wall biosynthesis